MRQPPWAWQEALATTLGRWHEARAAVAPPAWLAADDLQRLADQPPARREQFLALARRRLATFPFELVHPGWLVPHIPVDPLLRQWCLALLPPPIRERLLPLLPRGHRPASGVRSDTVGPPRWLATWWRGELQGRLDYPHPFPWELHSEQPLTWLWRLPDGDLQVLLRRFGLRLVAAGVSRLPHGEVVQWVYRFPAELREVLVGLVRDRRFPEVDGWAARLVAHAEESAPSEVSLHLALVDVAAQAVARRRVADAERTAYRLPPDLGRELLVALGPGSTTAAIPADAAKVGGAAEPADLAALAVAPETWDAWLREDVAALVEARQMAAPDLREEAA